MRTLSQCTGCGRFVAADGGPCPFCDAPVASPPPRPASGHRSRAAVLATAAALGAVAGGAAAAAGCAPAKDAQDHHLAAPDAGPADAAVARGAPDAQVLEPYDDFRQHRRNCDNCPYGAPPLPLERVLA
ncbi:MAG: hypothetical protein HY908_13660 [Myxococcales bacterium]|nr:hypothetical protein [Myxococcales bacterium]